MRPINILYFLLPFLGVSQLQEKDAIANKLFVCYGKVNPELITGYDLVILESEHYTSSEIAIFNRNNTKVAAYISLTEVNEYASFYKEMAPYTLGKNGIWNSRFIDIKNKKAQEVLLKVINKIKQKGIEGLFLDNLDNVSQWGNLRNQKEEFIALLKRIKVENKNLFLVQNSGLFLAKELKNITNSIVVESVVSAYDFAKKEYAIRDINTQREIVKNLRQAKKIAKKPIYIIEYAETSRMKKMISREAKKIDFSVFVAQIDLQSIPKFKI
ncbi:endo alpha-1,4 polygalactosaminidase [uncultured Maribacter sp.]|uniref:endo alpha-1,4 polygalactosaminidase n=1 Tax=uncultured Maribacter sp. TaxID=431308 RepID=UPI00263530C8|nr:endo alpha-1,4 polygalactosaminidase [uncultured Maribacter sp.]